MTKKYYSTIEAAKILRLSRIGIFNRIKRGKLKAERVGRNYIISHEEILEALGKSIGKEKKENIEKAVDKALVQYEKTFKLLGKE